MALHLRMWLSPPPLTARDAAPPRFPRTRAEAAYKSVITDAGPDQTSATPANDVLGLSADRAHEICEEVRADNFDTTGQQQARRITSQKEVRIEAKPTSGEGDGDGAATTDILAQVLEENADESATPKKKVSQELSPSAAPWPTRPRCFSAARSSRACCRCPRRGHGNGPPGGSVYTSPPLRAGRSVPNTCRKGSIRTGPPRKERWDLRVRAPKGGRGRRRECRRSGGAAGRPRPARPSLPVVPRGSCE